MNEVLVLVFIASLFLTVIAVPSIINIAEKKNLMDIPNQRKKHKLPTPTLGGVAIFGSVTITLNFFATYSGLVEISYLTIAFLLLFFIGVKDDLFDLVAYKKIIVQLIASVVIVYMGDIRIHSFFGIFGINELSYYISVIFTVIVCMAIMNSFNLIDGIDGLCVCMGIIASLVFAVSFYVYNALSYALISISLLGALTGVLYYNRSPAKIFIGDTGSLFVGFLVAVQTVNFLNILSVENNNAPVIAISAMIFPVFDTIRVIFIRISQGRSLLRGDDNHLHHEFIKRGFSHTSTVLVFSSLSLFAIFISWQIKFDSNLLYLITIFLVFFISSYLFTTLIPIKGLEDSKKDLYDKMIILPLKILPKTNQKHKGSNKKSRIVIQA